MLRSTSKKRHIQDKKTSMSKKQRTALTLAQKKELCQKKVSNPSLKNIEIANENGIGESTVSEILKAKDRWLAFEDDSPQKNSKRERKSFFPQIEEAVSLWAEQAIQDGITFNSIILQNKAKKLAELMGIRNFLASDGWLFRFRQRNDLRVYRRRGELDSVDKSQLPQQRIELQQILSQYELSDIYNCDETALFWKAEPNHTLAHAPISGTKRLKDRVSIMVTCNATGDHKLPLLFIHRSQTPRCLKGILKSSLPVWYYWNAKAWMVRSIFGHYLNRLDSMMRRANRHILLLADNAASHKPEEVINNLINIKLHFLPPNTTSVLQPLDQGIIYSLKAHYRSLLCENRIEEYDLLRTHMEFTTETSISSQQLPPLTILNAINFAAGAWDRVKQRVIQSSWQKSGILPLTVQPMTNEAEENLESEVINLVAQLPSEEPMNTVREYIDLEESIYNVTDYNEERDSRIMREIVATIQGHSDEEEEEEEEVRKVSSAEAINSVDSLLYCT